MGNSNTELLDNINDIIEDFSVAMLTSIDVNNKLSACPMTLVCHEEETGIVYFATSEQAGKVSDIENNPHAALTFQSNTQFVSLSGMASISNDRELIHKLFKPAWEAWFPEGPGQEDIRLIKFNADQGEYWDMSGFYGLKFLWNAGKAILHDEKIAVDDDPESHGKVVM
uniref:General stress protein n=1 Tax=uncultured Thiotrichaceae bacterium TaxID=298394 RepID=A0A6S6UDS0_9GAMM|nr:MAG: General stress protein [uncultured Thiotrichaceae bacterium]